MKKVLQLLVFLLPQIAFSQGVDVTSWSVNTTGHQAQYYNSSSVVVNLNDSSEVLELCYNTDTLYIRTSFLASYIMGDWPGDPFLADGQNKKYNFPRNPTYPASTHKTKPTSITGLLLNGVPIYDDGDGKSYNTSTNKNDNSGSGVWNQLAWVAHASEMDAGNCHPDPNNNYHNHFNPIMLYDETASSVHSPIIGWAFDGFPIYGPFGYTDAMDANSAIKRMTSSWALRNITTRTTLYTGATASQTGPAVSATFPLGMYKEDYGYTASSGDLDYYNGRYCVTPEFPSGTYAYFLNTDATGEASYPNMIGPTYYGSTTFAGITGPSSGNATKPTTSITCVTATSTPTVTLSTGATSIAEASGSTTVTATLSASTTSAVTVNLSLSGTATVTSDYTLSTSISIPAGSTSASITLTAVQDVAAESGETVIIDISSVTNATESGTQQKTVTITDDDSAPTVTLSSGSSSISEAAGSTTITATLSSSTTSTVTVNLSFSGTATVTSDYTLSTSISIPSGSTSASITLTAVQDVATEGTETVIVDISSVTNATESGTQQVTVSITDDESSSTSDAIINSWIMNVNGKKASYWLTTGSGMSVTYTYTNSTDSADVLQLCYSDDYVWVRSEGMTNDMGKYLNPGSCIGQDYTFRFPRNPVVPTTKVESPYTGAIGLLLNGIPVYGLSNSNSWTGSGMSPMGAGVWNAEVGYNEGFVLDTAFGAHPQQDGAYHTHATPFRLYKDVSTSQHSPIVGYAFDGYPIYGPYGYSSATDANSGVTRMKSGYALRNITTRTTLPDGSTASQTGPSVSATYPLGYFIEDYQWSAANGGDLDEYNGRYCVTPEYPNGTYAYFTAVTSTGAAQFPYYIGTYFYGTPEADDLAINPTITIPSSGTSCSTTSTPTVTLSGGAASISETSGSTTITATLSASTTSAVTVNLSLSGTATSSGDYTLATSITIPAGSTSASITLSSIDDAVNEGNETVIVDISSVTNATESGTQQVTVTINDNDMISSVDTYAAIDQNVSIYPNPTEGVVTISLTNMMADISIFDSKGMLMKTIDGASSDNEISLEGFGAGIYQAVFKLENGATYTKKIALVRK